MGDTSVVSATPSTKKKKKNVLKSIARGISFKKKKKRSDDESVVGVALENDSVTSGFSSAKGRGSNQYKLPQSDGSGGVAGKGGIPSSINENAPILSNSTSKPIQVVLLLMDPESRRFELLQLEFDSHKALVSDVLRQIQSSATEKNLREMLYVGVCDRDGLEMNQSLRLSQFCKGNEVVMAMPKGMSGKETSTLAKPILGDPKVMDMLRPCGVQLQSTAFKGSKKSNSSVTVNKKLTKISEEDVQTKKKKSIASSDVRKKAASLGVELKLSIIPTISLAALIIAIIVITMQHHNQLIKPISSGSVLFPGQWKSHCGVSELLPKRFQIGKKCRESKSMLEMGNDGVLRYFSKNEIGLRREVWKAVGDIIDTSTCPHHDGTYDEQNGQCAQGMKKNIGATFLEDDSVWFVLLGEKRTMLSKDVVRDYTQNLLE